MHRNSLRTRRYFIAFIARKYWKLPLFDSLRMQADLIMLAC